MTRSFSKIWIIVVLVVLIAGGIIAYQYWWLPKEEDRVLEIEVPEEAVSEKAIEEVTKTETEECFLLLGFWSKNNL